MIQIGGVYANFCLEEGILLQKYRDRNGRCIAILFRSIRVRGRFLSLSLSLLSLGFITWPQLEPFFVPACPPLTAIDGY